MWAQWNASSRLALCDSARWGDSSPGPVLARRRFVEMALGAGAGVVVHGTGASATLPSPTAGFRRPCDGEWIPESAISGIPAQIIETDSYGLVGPGYGAEDGR